MISIKSWISLLFGFRKNGFTSGNWKVQKYTSSACIWEFVCAYLSTTTTSHLLGIRRRIKKCLLVTHNQKFKWSSKSGKTPSFLFSARPAWETTLMSVWFVRRMVRPARHATSLIPVFDGEPELMADSRALRSARAVQRQRTSASAVFLIWRMVCQFRFVIPFWMWMRLRMFLRVVPTETSTCSPWRTRLRAVRISTERLASISNYCPLLVNLLTARETCHTSAPSMLGDAALVVPLVLTGMF